MVMFHLTLPLIIPFRQITMKLILSASVLALLFSSCALITTPVKVAGAVATTSIKTTGKVVGASIDMATSDDDADDLASQSEAE